VKLIDSIGGRKAFMVFWFSNLAGLLTAFDKLNGGEFVTVTIALVAAYVTGNVYEATKTPKERQV
jgi:hypothetical protein